MLLAAVLLATLQGQASADTTAYLDPAARTLVARARAHRATAEQTITDYHAEAKERISLGLRALRRDRTFYQREMAGRIAWHRYGPDTIVMLGAREAIPVAYAGSRVPEDMVSDAPDLGFTPGEDRFIVGIGDSEFVYDPLAPGSETRYRFQSGDTTTITLQDGRTIRLLELRIIPRRDDFHLLTGSFWLEDDHAALVRAVFRPARPWDMDRDLAPSDSADAHDVPGFLKPIRAEVRFITVEYALLEGKWWLPRLVAFDASASAGSIMTLPLRYERVLTFTDVSTGGHPGADSLAVDRLPGDSLPSDSADIAACAGRADCRCNRHRCRRAVVIVPPDTASLLTSDALPPSFDDAGPFLSTAEARELGRAVGLLPQTPWQAHAPRLRLGPGGAGLVRYNRVEALSIGARLGVDFGRLTADATARVGLGDAWPNLELGLGHETADVAIRLAGYRRLAVANPDTKALGIGNSLAALVLGRDDGVYYRTWGGELLLQPVATAARSYAWRVFLEWQRPADKETDISVPHLFRTAHVFGPNIPAAAVREFGTSLVLRGAHGVSTRGITAGAELAMDVHLGTFDYGRAALTTRLTAPLPGKLLGALEVAGGMTGGVAPVQGEWFLGGPASLRGYGGAALAGPDFWRGRVEVANQFPAARLAAFSDAGWAGTGVSLGRGRPLVSAGLGASFLDGIVRIDLARGLSQPRGWRMDFYVDGIL
jgi:hypothetical protein